MLLLHPLECRTLILKLVISVSGDKVFFSRNGGEDVNKKITSALPLLCFALLGKEGSGRGGGG